MTSSAASHGRLVPHWRGRPPAALAPGIAAWLCIQLASGAAQATPPIYDPVREACVMENMLLGPNSYSDLPFPDQVDWSKFEGQIVRFKVHNVPPARLVTPPVVLGPCDPVLVAASLPRALAQRSEYEFLFQKDQAKALADIERAIKVVPENCDFAASYVFILQGIGRRKDADAQATRVAGTACAQRYREHLRWLRQGTVVKLF
ncbi:MAG: hypothetical protein P4M07_05405 [Xanthobacteraceae bacterium]|nr:hypothetical protein [Xanthobacteraceae bacterium]